MNSKKHNKSYRKCAILIQCMQYNVYEAYIVPIRNVIEIYKISFIWFRFSAIQSLKKKRDKEIGTCCKKVKYPSVYFCI